jgi:hypothetical protein
MIELYYHVSNIIYLVVLLILIAAPPLQGGEGGCRFGHVALLSE